MAIAVAYLGVAAQPASAFRIELKDVAPDRIERQRAEASGLIPFPGTPNIAQFDQRLKDKGIAVGAAMFIRVFKAESELEVWLQKGDKFELFATYPICHWSGTLGPKVTEGDKQSPEGIYTVSSRQLHLTTRHPKALNLGFPNPLDKQFKRTGSYVLIHGGCGSVGCFAMTNPVIDEIFTLAQAALRGGQDLVHVHAFPFRLTEQKLRAYALHEWYDYWRNLKDVHDAFERTKRPPRVVVCEGRYWVDPASETEGNGEVASQGPLAVCGLSQEVASLNSPTDDAQSPTGSNWSPLPRAQQVPLISLPPTQADLAPEPASLRELQNRNRSSRRVATVAAVRPPVTTAALQRGQQLFPTSPPIPIACATSLPSCRKWIAQQTAMVQRRAAAARTTAQQAQPRAALRR